jgi:hypothetical protein
LAKCRHIGVWQVKAYGPKPCGVEWCDLIGRAVSRRWDCRYCGERKSCGERQK